MWVSCLQTVFSCFLIGLKVKRCLNDIWKKRLFRTRRVFFKLL